VKNARVAATARHGDPLHPIRPGPARRERTGRGAPSKARDVRPPPVVPVNALDQPGPRAVLRQARDGRRHSGQGPAVLSCGRRIDS
jgi:hypothetical protein